MHKMQLHLQREKLKKNRVFVVDSMRKQELKSRKKVHARKKGKKRLHPTLQQREITVVRYKPEIVAIEKIEKRVKESARIKRRK